MKKKYFCQLMCCVVIVIFFPCTPEAEFYKYTDQEGTLIYTDDLSRVPLNQKDKITTFNSIQPVDHTPGETADRSVQETLSTDKVSTQREELEREYLRLQQARKELMEEKAEVTTVAEQQAYNEKVTLLNQQIEQFSQRLDSFNKTVSGENGDPGS